MQMVKAILASLFLAQAAPSMAGPPQPPVAFGPAPDWERFKSLAESTVKERLIDPDSAKFTWNFGYATTSYKPFLQPRVWGYVACAEVNSKNRMGGYTGGAMFAVAMDDDKIRYLEVARDRTDYAEIACENMIRAQAFPPASEMHASSLPDATGLSSRSSLSALTCPTSRQRARPAEPAWPRG